MDELKRAAELCEHKVTTEECHRALDMSQFIGVPYIDWNETLLSRCRSLYESLVLTANGAKIDGQAITIEKWVFLEYLTFHVGLLAHGSNDLNIQEFELRTPKDNLVDGGTPRIYASQSGLVSMFYAILNRPFLKELPNVLAGMGVYHIPRRTQDGRQDDRYHFAIDYRAVPHFPWRTGMIHVFEREGFKPDYASTQWFSEQTAWPLARFEVQPSEWPLLDKVHGQDLLAFHERFNQNPTGWPWTDDETLYPNAINKLKSQ